MSVYSGRGIVPQQFRRYVIRATLEHLGEHTDAFEELLFMTVAHESLGGRLLHQHRGSAVGVFQIEPRTHDDIWKNYLAYKPRMAAKVKALASTYTAEECITNLKYCCAMAAMVYIRAKDDVPSNPKDLWALAAFYKLYYNTYLGSATLKQTIDDYHRWT